MFGIFFTSGKRFSLLLSLLVGGLLTAGCMENAVLIKVNPDGSGEITYRLHFSDAMLQAMQTAAQPPEPEPEAEAETEAEAQDPEAALQAYFRRMMEYIAPQLGDGVVLDRDRFSTTMRGWQGFEAFYVFENIETVRLDNIDPLGTSPGEAQRGSSSMGGRYTFSFEPGEPATLELVPIPDVPSGYPYDLDPTGPTDWHSLLGADLSEEMFRLLEGLRITIYLAVNGTVEESNASFASARVPNVFTLLDIPFDRIAARPDAFAAIQKAGPDMAAILAAIDVPEVRVEEPGKTIRIRFR